MKRANSKVLSAKGMINCEQHTCAELSRSMTIKNNKYKHMKTIFYILILALVTFSCNSDDDAHQNTDPTLIGSWSIVNVYGGFAGVDDDFETGTIIWNFNEDPSELNITNNNTTEVIYSGYPSGTYNYEVITTTNDTTLVIENTDFKILNLTTSHLIIDEGVTSDGFQYTFSR